MALTCEQYINSSACDNFGGPAAWDRYIAEKEEAYRERVEGKTCLDCQHCEPCLISGHEGIGYCIECGEFVSDDNTVYEMQLDCFAAESI